MQTNPSASFGDLLKRFRLAAGLSQEELAERAGLSPRGVSDLERGARTNPRPGTVRLLADALALSDTDHAAFLAAAHGAQGYASRIPNADPQSTPMHEMAPDRSAPHLLAPASSTPAMPPTGTVTFLFTDIEGSTQLLQQIGTHYAVALSDHQRILRAAFMAHSGYEVDTQGDSFFVAFPTAPDALAAAAEAIRALTDHPWPEGVTLRVRMGLHTGAPQLVGDHYVGLDVHRAARIAAAGHGGQILLSASTSALVEHDLPDGATLRELGAHRLKDLQRPEPISQLVQAGLPTDFPPLKTLNRREHNLPIQLTPLLGRAREVDDLCTLLRRDDVRLVTVTGPGGVGKTRLGLQVAADVGETFPDGIWFVRLAPLTDPTLVIPTIAQTLGLSERGIQPIHTVLREWLQPRQLLLLLDNCEHVAAAAPEVAICLADCAGLKVLATSREELHVLGEQAYPLAPLALPAASSADGTGLARAIERPGASPAVALFLARAQAHQPHLPLTAENLAAVAAICERLDGLPLAIELAAAHIKVLPPPAMLQRLERRLSLLVGGARDVEARQQTMRATLAWSEDLLQPAERRLFQRLSVFAGSFTLAAAEAVCAAPAGAEALGLDVLEGLERLVDKSLVAPWHAEEQAAEGEPRFRLLYVIREYAQERLRERGEAEALRQAHAAYYVAFMDQWWAVTMAAALASQGWVAMRALVDQLQPEQDNLRAALTWLRACAEAPQSRQRLRVGDTGGHTDQQAGARLAAAVASPIMQGLSLAGNLLWRWSFDGYLSEGRAWLGTFLALDTLSSSWESAVGAEYEGRKGRKGREAQEYQEANVTRATLVRARALYAAGVLAYWQDDIDGVVPLLERSLALLRTLDDRLMLGLVLNNLGMACGHQGDLEKARAYFEESLALGRALGFGLHVMNVLGSLSELALAAGDLERASIVSEEALTESRRAQNVMNGAQALRVQVIIAWRQGHLSQAAALAKEALTLTMETRDVRFYADSLVVCAIVCAMRGQDERAARWLGAALAYRERLGMQLMPRRLEVPSVDDIETAIATARATLGDAAWAAAFAGGQALSLEEAIAEALGNAK